MPTWVLFAIAAGFASNLYNFLNRYILRKESDSSVFGWITELSRLLIAMSFVAFDFSFVPSPYTVGVFLFIGIVEIVSIYIFMKMHAYSHLSVSTIISRTRLIWIPLLAFFLLGEKLNPIEYIGIAVLFLGLSIAVSPKKIFFDKGIFYAYTSAFVVAILSIVMKAGSAVMSISMILIGMSLLTVVSYPFLLKDGKQRIKKAFKKNMFLKLLSGTSNTISMYLYIYALSIGDVSKVTAVYQGMMIVSVLAGIILLRERQDVYKKLIGAVITLGAVILLSLY